MDENSWQTISMSQIIIHKKPNKTWTKTYFSDGKQNNFMKICVKV